MCTALIIGAVGTGISAVSAFQQQRAQNDAAEYNARVADVNAELAEQQSVQAGQLGVRSERQLRQQGRRLAGAQRTAFAASGVDVGSGTARSVLSDTSRQTELDALDIRYNTAIQQRGFGIQAQGFRQGAALQRASRVSPRRAAGLTLLAGASTLGSQFFLNRG